MLAAEVKNGVVTNVIVGTGIAGHIDIPADQDVGIGWTYDPAGGAFTAPPPPPATPQDVDIERDRRIAAGFPFSGKTYQSRPDDLANITGAALLAQTEIAGGRGKAGDLRWHGGQADFVWIAADNSLATMDAPTVIAFGRTALAHKSRLIFAARRIKNRIVAGNPPADIADDKAWT